MSTLKTVLTTLRRDLKQKDKVRETSQKKMRKATSISKQAILMIHQKRLTQAKRLIKDAREILARLWETSTAYPDLIYTGSFSAALQEYSEANIFLKLVENTTFLEPQEINVPPSDYVLGLADVIGEFRRVALDALREGNTKAAENCLSIMDEIYVELMAMDESYMLVPGLRRKCDVARKIIEITRGDVTQEIRRNMLDRHLKQFERSIKAPRRIGGTSAKTP